MTLKSPGSFLWLAAHAAMVIAGIYFIDSQFVGTLLSRDLAIGIGGSLIASGIAGATLFFYVRSSERNRATTEFLFEAGLQRIFPHRSVRMREEYETRIKDAKEIDILGFGLASFREDFGDRFGALSKQTKFRIIVLDPDFPSGKNSFANLRDREEKNTEGQIKSEVKAFIDAAHASDIDRERFQLRQLRAIPSINLFRIDGVIFWGPYLVGGQSRNMPTLLVRQGGFLFVYLRKHFDDLWANPQLTAVI